MEKKSSSKKDEQEEKEKQRVLAMTNLSDSSLRGLAVTYLVNSNNSYGEAINSAVEQFKYLPAIYDSQEHIVNTLLASRQDQRRYSGQISEHDLINKAANVINDSLGMVYVQDVFNLMGLDTNVDTKYKDKLVSELSDEDREKLTGTYLTYFVDSEVSDALNARALVSRKSLEDLLGKSSPKKER